MPAAPIRRLVVRARIPLRVLSRWSPFHEDNFTANCYRALALGTWSVPRPPMRRHRRNNPSGDDGLPGAAGGRRRPADRSAARDASPLRRLGHPRRPIRRQPRRCQDHRLESRAPHHEQSAGCAGLGLGRGQDGVREFRNFRRLHPALSNLDLKDIVPSEAVMANPPGALAYYREAGLIH